MADDLGDEWWLGGGDVGEVLDDQGQGGVTTKTQTQRNRRQETLKGSKRDELQHKQNKETINKNQSKRKQNAAIDNDGSESKKKKKKKKTLSEHLASATEKPGTLDDLQVSMATYFHEKLSVVEMEELILDAHQFVDHNAGKESISEYLGRIAPDWAERVKAEGGKTKAPNKSCTLLLLTSSARRAVELNRDAAPFKGTCVTAKLFAKHMKMSEQEKFLASHRVHFAVGTPHRVSCLLNAGALTMDDTETVILDWNWRDAKLRKFVDIPELKKDLFELLRKHLVPAANKGQLKLGLY